MSTAAMKPGKLYGGFRVTCAKCGRRATLAAWSREGAMFQLFRRGWVVARPVIGGRGGVWKCGACGRAAVESGATRKAVRV